MILPLLAIHLLSCSATFFPPGNGVPMVYMSMLEKELLFLYLLLLSLLELIEFEAENPKPPASAENETPRPRALCLYISLLLNVVLETNLSPISTD